MTIVETMRSQLRDSMKAADSFKTQFLRYWITQFTKGDGSELSDSEAVKKMRAVVNESKKGVTTFTERELEMIQQWLPAMMTHDDILVAIAPHLADIKNARNDGQAMGVVMKSLKGGSADTDMVKSIVAQIRAEA